ncbi:thioredoxin-like protein 1 [Ornithodoros turicata]|uniref:thioredoxin-like protein 1 n=1 Tax=Ornithodoros turicata TaxID=34597 RepID=UPI003139275F
MPVKQITDEARFQAELSNSGHNLVVVDFTASWCVPCQRIAPHFESLSNKYLRAVFLKVDIDQCRETAAAQGVSSVPTFVFFRNKQKVTTLTGADPGTLERKIQELLASTPAEGPSAETVQGHVDIATYVDKSATECLNESDDHTLASCLASGDGYLESDCDEQLIISLGFIQPVKLHSLKVEGPPNKGPKTVKLFINQPRTLGFDQALSMEPTQLLELTAKDLEGAVVPLRYVKFQNVQNLQILIKDNQAGTETTQINRLVIYGSPLTTTNMGDFKRVAGKKGESH